MNASGGKPIGVPYMMKKELKIELSQKCYISIEQKRKEKLEKNKKREHDADDDALTSAHVIDNAFAQYIFFDYETMNIEGLHEPNLIIAD